jgi:hypothetical protein
MSGKSLRIAFASMATLGLLAVPAAAGGYYHAGAYSAGCNCYTPAPRMRVVYGAQPVTYYEARQVYVPQQVYVKRQAYVRTRMYVVDQGPSFYLPAVHHTRTRVYMPHKRPYPYGGSYPSRYRHHAYRGYRHGYRAHRHVRRAAYRSYRPAYRYAPRHTTRRAAYRHSAPSYRPRAAHRHYAPTMHRRAHSRAGK